MINSYSGDILLFPTSKFCHVSSLIIQRPTAAQLLDHPFIKRTKKESGLKDHKLLLDRCQHFQKGRKKECKEPELAKQRYVIVCSEGIATCYQNLQ
jgi:hypothetical protein